MFWAQRNPKGVLQLGDVEKEWVFGSCDPLGALRHYPHAQRPWLSLMKIALKVHGSHCAYFVHHISSAYSKSLLLESIGNL